MSTVCRRAGGLAALLLSCSLLMAESGLAQTRTSSVSVVRDQSEPCLSYDPSGALAECADTGALFQGTGRAAIPAGGSPTVTLSAGVSLQGAAAAPLFESVGAQAMLQDAVTLSGPGATARVTFVFRITGGLFQLSPPDATATLQVDVLGQGQVWNSDQSIDETIAVTLDLDPGIPQGVTIFGSARASMTRLNPQSPGGSAGVGTPTAASIRVEAVRITDADGAPIPGATLVSDLGYAYPVLDTPAGGGIVSVGPVTLWLAMENNNDTTPLDLRAEVYRNSTLVTSGELRCLRNLADRRGRPREVAIALGAPADTELAPGDMLSLRVLARIGTNADSTACARPGKGLPRSEGLRLYYDSSQRPARLALEIAGEPPADLFLRSDGHQCQSNWPRSHANDLELDPAPPTDDHAKYRDSGRLDFGRGNPWNEIDTWTTTIQ